MTENTDRVGPIDYVVVEFPEGRVTGQGFRRLIELSDEARILVLDVEFLRKDAGGQVTTVPAHEFGEIDGLNLGEFDGADAHLLDRDDIADIGTSMTAGSVAVVVIYEELSMLSALAAWQNEGAVLLAEGPVDVDDLVAALDSTDPLRR